MANADIDRLWETINQNFREVKGEENEPLFEQILQLAEQHNIPLEAARVKLFQYNKLKALPKRNPSAVERDISQQLGIVRAVGDLGAEALGLEALARYHILSGDAIRANECCQALQAVAGKTGDPLVKMVAKFSIEEFWEEVMLQERAKATPEPLEMFLQNTTVLKIEGVKTRIGDYVTFDAAFAATVSRRIKELKHQVHGGLAKPENFLLQADPGSGKSYFVKQIVKQLRGARFLVHNLTGYQTLEHALSDLFTDILIAAPHHKVLVSFIDEADTTFGTVHLYERFIAVMNGEQFIFNGKTMSFGDCNLVFFFAASSPMKDIEGAFKGKDFLNRIPSENRLTLPSINASYREKIYRAAIILKSGKPSIARVHARVLYFIGLKAWSSTRELELLLKHAIRRIPRGREHLELGDLPVSATEITDVQKASKINIFGFIDKILSIE